MKYALVLAFLAFGSVVVAQDEQDAAQDPEDGDQEADQDPEVPEIPEVDPEEAFNEALSESEREFQSCLAACPQGDVTCTTTCFVIPNPSVNQAEEAGNCIAACNETHLTDAAAAGACHL